MAKARKEAPRVPRARLERAFRVGRSRTGLGLFATVPIEKGAFIVEYRGRRISRRQARRREARGSRYMFELDERWTIDGSSRRNLARYANHACRPNAEAALLSGRLILRALRRIRPGEEITYDYGQEYFDLFLAPAGCRCERCLKRRRRRRRGPAADRRSPPT
jgi:SET domain-containing protein